jgi:hypothetical protein
MRIRRRTSPSQDFQFHTSSSASAPIRTLPTYRCYIMILLCTNAEEPAPSSSDLRPTDRRPHDEHRALRLANDTLSYATDNQARKTLAPVRSHHD